MTSLDEEIKKEMVKLPFFIRGKDQIAFARYFAEWGAEHAREQILKDVVEGEVYKFGEVAYVKERNNAELTKYLSRFNNGDKVKIIVIHETDIR